jgi:anti-sigma B factor antagonist
MPFSTREQYHAVVVQITGRFLGSIEGPKFKDTLEELKEAGKTHLVIDLSKADFMDSSGIGILIGALTTMKKAGGDVKLAGMKDRIKNLFLLTRLLGPVFEDYDSVEEAADALAGEES